MTLTEKRKLKLRILILKLHIFYNKMLMSLYLLCRNCVGLYLKFIKFCLGVSNE